jgi:hypothetical protein
LSPNLWVLKSLSLVDSWLYEVFARMSEIHATRAEAISSSHLSSLCAHDHAACRCKSAPPGPCPQPWHAFFGEGVEVLTVKQAPPSRLHMHTSEALTMLSPSNDSSAFHPHRKAYPRRELGRVYGGDLAHVLGAVLDTAKLASPPTEWTSPTGTDQDDG